MLDPVRERFVQEYHQHSNASEAYRAAKPKATKWKPETVHVKACNMLKEDKVQVRLHELQQRSAAKHEITVDTITAMLKEDRDLARQNAQSGAAVTAAMGLAKLHGLITEKREVKHVTGVEDLADDELGHIARTGSNRTPATKGVPPQSH
jgi:hypothetical protein